MSETHIPGQTTRTAQRAPEDFTQPVHHLDLDEDCANLLEEEQCVHYSPCPIVTVHFPKSRKSKES